MTKTKKTFDAIAMMRAARDEISERIENMTLEEELRWLAEQQISEPFLQRLRDRSLVPSKRQDPLGDKG